MTYQKHKNLNSETKTDIKTHEPIQNELTQGLKNKTKLFVTNKQKLMTSSSYKEMPKVSKE